MRIIKILFSKTILVVFAFLIQAVIFFTTLKYFYDYFIVFQTISIIISLIVFLYLVNKKECIEFKLPWLLVLVSFPYFGMILYLMLYNPKFSRKTEKKLKEFKLKKKFSVKYQDNEKEKIKEIIKDNLQIETYLNNISYTRGYLNTKTTYLNSGEMFLKDLLIELKQAKEFIFMEYFIIKPGMMWDSIHEILLSKVKENVDVRIIYDDIGSLGYVESDFYKKLQKEGIKCYKFNPFYPILSGIYNNRDHRKITIIDGNIAYTGGINIGDEYINLKSPYGHWKDSAIKLNGPAVSNLTTMFLEVYNSISKKEEDIEKYIKINLEENINIDYGFVHPFGDGPKPIYQEQISENNFINMINNAKKYVYITTPYLIIDYNLTTALRSAALKGIDVRIITPHIPDKKIIFNLTRSNYKYLLEAGVKIYEYTPGFIHQKSLVVDNRLAFVGTVNLDYRSLVHHYECGVVLFNTDSIKDIYNDIKNIIEVSQEITLSNFKMKKIDKLISIILSIFSPLF